MIDCGECQEYLEESALSDEASMMPEAKRHLDNCGECRIALARRRDAWALLPLALEPEAVDSEVESRLMQRIEFSLKNESRPRWYKKVLVNYGLAASILIVVFSSVLVWSRQQVAATRSATVLVNEIQQQLDQFNEWKQGFGQPNLQFVSLQDVSAPPQAHAYLVHDLLGEEGHFFAYDLQRLPSGQVYKLWILGKDGQIPASTVLELDDKGIASASVAIPRSAKIERTLVTAELDPAAAHPSDDARLQAAIE